MKKRLLILLAAVFSLVFVSNLSAQGSNSYVNAFSTISYDAGTNTVTGYSYTQPAYVNALYYTTGVSANIYDQNGNMLAQGQGQGGNGGSAQINLQATGNGCGYYRIGAGHWQVETYYVSNYYWNGSYYNGYYDAYNYSSFTDQNGNDYLGSYQFDGPGPYIITYDTFRFLGSTEQFSEGSCSLPPRITNMTPAFGAPGATLQVSIAGNGFTNTMGVSSVKGSPITISNVIYVSPQLITAIFQINSYAVAGVVPIQVGRFLNMSNRFSFEIRVPHHLKVISDVPATNRNCPPGPVARILTLEVEDVNGNPTGDTQVKEDFTAVSFNTCLPDGIPPDYPPGAGPIPSSCEITSFSPGTGRFQDAITVNCNDVNGSCGYDITDLWQWCPPGRAAVTLATLTETVHADQVTVNGNSSHFAPNTLLLP